MEIGKVWEARQRLLICCFNKVMLMSSIIDNNQKVGKCGRRIKEGSKVAISICTTVGHIKPNPKCYLQREQEFAPENWLGKLASNKLGK